MTEVLINGRWPINLPEHRAGWVQWPWWEKERLAAMYATMRRGDVVLDVGSEQGDLSALYQTWVGPGGGVILCEPEQTVWPSIRTTWELNDLPDPLFTFVGFVADQGAERGALNVGGFPICAQGEINPEAGFKHLNEDDPEISRITVDLISKELHDRFHQKINVITMDVEGAEFEVLTGAHVTLETDRPIVFVSVHPEFMRDRYNHYLDDLLQMMTDGYGYEPSYLGFDHEQHWMFRP